MNNAPFAFTIDGVYCTACLAKSDYRGLRLKHFDSCAWFRALEKKTR